MKSLDSILAEYFNNGDLDGLYVPWSFNYSEKGAEAYNSLISLLQDVSELTEISLDDVITALDKISEE